MSVSMKPRCTPTTSVPWSRSSALAVLVNDHAAALVAE